MYKGVICIEIIAQMGQDEQSYTGAKSLYIMVSILSEWF